MTNGLKPDLQSMGTLEFYLPHPEHWSVMGRGPPERRAAVYCFALRSDHFYPVYDIGCRVVVIIAIRKQNTQKSISEDNDRGSHSHCLGGGYLGLMLIDPCNRTSSEPRPSETLLEYISRESGVKDLSCSKDSSESTTEENAMAVPPDYGYQFVKIPDGYYNCKATITNTTSKDVDPGASVDVILNVRGDTATLTRTSNGEILKHQEPGLGD